MIVDGVIPLVVEAVWPLDLSRGRFEEASGAWASGIRASFVLRAIGVAIGRSRSIFWPAGLLPTRPQHHPQAPRGSSGRAPALDSGKGSSRATQTWIEARRIQTRQRIASSGRRAEASDSPFASFSRASEFGEREAAGRLPLRFDRPCFELGRPALNKSLVLALVALTPPARKDRKLI